MHIRRSFTSEQELKEIQDFIYQKSKEGKGFNGILEAAFNEVTITTAIHNIKGNKGANTPGIDGNKMDRYLQMDREKLMKLIHTMVNNYKPSPVRRIYIPKANGKLRPLGIPTAIEKIIQECIKIIIEPICEARFYPHSYGFRPYRATNHAMKMATSLLCLKTEQKAVIAIEGDIEAFFDNLNHRILLQKLYKMGVCDRRILSMIKQMLRAGYMYHGEKYITEIGTIQGGVLSPLLANVYLNDFDWMIGRMYQEPKSKGKVASSARKTLRNRGVAPKYLIRYCDDWIILTTMLDEALKILMYIHKYYRHRLKLNLSKEKTMITNLTEKKAKFLGYELEARPPRGSPQNIGYKGLVGKFYPIKEKVCAKTQAICKEIWKLRNMKSTKEKAAQVEKINTIIVGTAEHYKVAICSNTFRFMDGRISEAAYRTFRKIYGKQYKRYKVPLAKLSNRPQRHQKRMDKTYAVKYKGLWVGITKTYITHSQRDKCNFNQRMTPYTEEGRKFHAQRMGMERKMPLNRPPIYDEMTLFYCKEKHVNNFEYYMNREYAYNRDKGRCKICKTELLPYSRHCHRINPTLPMGNINKVQNLVWLCLNCLDTMKSGSMPPNATAKMKSRFLKYQGHFKVLN